MNTESYCAFLLRLLRKGSLVATTIAGLTLYGCAGESDSMDDPIQSEGYVSDDHGDDVHGGDVHIMANDGEDSYVDDSNADDGYAEASMTPSGPVEEFELTGDNSAGYSDDSSDVTAEIISDPSDSDDYDSSADFQMTSLGSSCDAVEDAISFSDGSDDVGAAYGDDQLVGSSSGIVSITPGQGWSVSSPGAAKFVKSKSEYASSKSHVSGGSNTYVVRRGDTLSRIAQRVYGNMNEWKSLAAANGISAPYVIFPGNRLKLDPTKTKSTHFAQSGQGATKTIKVQRGDTLSGIAQKVYGSPFSWQVIYAYNKDKISNPNVIHEGMVLAYKEGAAVPTAKSSSKSGSSSAKHSKSKLKHKAAPITPAQFQNDDDM